MTDPLQRRRLRSAGPAPNNSDEVDHAERIARLEARLALVETRLPDRITVRVVHSVAGLADLVAYAGKALAVYAACFALYRLAVSQ